MKHYKEIYLDMDGVCAMFTPAVIKQLNKVTGQNVTHKQIVKRCNWDLEKMWMNKSGNPMSQTEWWACIDKNPTFWFDIEPFPWVKELFDRLTDHCDKVTILSAPSRSSVCIEQKREWLYKHLSISYAEHPLFEKNKAKYASPDVLLIDDAKHNVDPFIAAGGNAVLVPSEWNTPDLTFEMVWEAIEKCL
jgi:5'(3')-deoxyribonucleotidase